MPNSDYEKGSAATETNEDWECPYCHQKYGRQYIHSDAKVHGFDTNERVGTVALVTKFAACSNPDCREYEITASLHNATLTRVESLRMSEYNPNGEALLSWRLKPQSDAIQFPMYVPKPIVDDYVEACAILILSPKASATLSRRCLQGIIRDFWKISRPRLIDEVNELKGKIEANLFEAIDAVRKIGNIGAHMEKDINMIIDIEPEEAEALKHLIEVLIQETYIAKNDRDQHLRTVIDIGKKK